MSSHRLFFLWLATILAGLLASSHAQTPAEANEGSHLTVNPNGSKTFSWWGRSGRTYFVQYSEDLLNWNYLPTAQSGANQVISLGLTSPANKIFLKLQYTDQPTTNPQTDDFDGDGILNGDELSFGTDPTSTDTDTDGLPDDWELQWSMDARNGDANGNGLTDAFDDFDGDGLTNEEEAAYGTNPFSTDSDGDTMPDAYELAYDFDPADAADGGEDADMDGYANAQDSYPKDYVAPDLERKVELWIQYKSERDRSPYGLPPDWLPLPDGPWESTVWEGPSSSITNPPEQRSRQAIWKISESGVTRYKASYYFKNLNPTSPTTVRWTTYVYNAADHPEPLERLTAHTLTLAANAASSPIHVNYPPSGQGTGFLFHEVSGAPEHGLDGYERYSAPGSTPKILECPWLMVPSGSTDHNSIVLTVQAPFAEQAMAVATIYPITLATTGSGLTLDKQSITSVPEDPLTNTNLEISGTGAGNDSYVVMTGENAPAAENKVKIVRAVRLPKLTFKVQPYVVRQRRLTPSGPVLSSPPQHLPTSQQLEDRLNFIFGKQMNVFFEVEPMIDIQADCDSGPGPFAAQYPSAKAYNSRFDFAIDQQQTTPEEAALYAAGQP